MKTAIWALFQKVLLCALDADTNLALIVVKPNRVPMEFTFSTDFNISKASFTVKIGI